MTAQDDDCFTVTITAPASRAIGRMDPKVVDAVLAFIDGPLADSPMRVTKPLTGELVGKRSGYVGIAFRVLVEVDESQRTVWVLRVAHRADVYRPWQLRRPRASPRLLVTRRSTRTHADDNGGEGSAPLRLTPCT